MNSIGDSDAYFNPERMLVQHQAALTLLQGTLADPGLEQLHWLDVACGRGQIIAHLPKVLSDNHRKKIHYFGYDIDNRHSRAAQQTAESAGMGALSFEIGDLIRLNDVCPEEQQYNFITLTNTVHEILPSRLATILFDCLNRLSPEGCFFVYDMDRLPVHELGAVLWSATEIKSIITSLCVAVGAADYEPAVGQWQHRSCNGWNIQIKRQHLQTDNILDTRGAAIAATESKIRELIEQKLQQTKSALENLTQYPAETGDEAAAKQAYLYDFWALTRAREAYQ